MTSASVRLTFFFFCGAAAAASVSIAAGASPPFSVVAPPPFSAGVSPLFSALATPAPFSAAAPAASSAFGSSAAGSSTSYSSRTCAPSTRTSPWMSSATLTLTLALPSSEDSGTWMGPTVQLAILESHERPAGSASPSP